MREALLAYVRRVDERTEPIRDDDPATKQRPAGPPSTIRRQDPTGPRECLPAYEVDFEPDWAFRRRSRAGGRSVRAGLRRAAPGAGRRSSRSGDEGRSARNGSSVRRPAMRRTGP